MLLFTHTQRQDRKVEQDRSVKKKCSRIHLLI